MAPIVGESVEWWPHWWDACPDRWDLYLATQAGLCHSRASLTKEEFLKWFPMFADAPEEWIEKLLTQAQQLNPSVWGSWLRWGQALFVAHFLSMREMHMQPGDDDQGGDSGGIVGMAASVSSFRAGPIAYTKDTSLEEKLVGDPMKQTIFGQQFLDLLRSRVAVGLVMVT